MLGQETLNEIFDLFVELEAADWQLDFPVIYASARLGMASPDPKAFKTSSGSSCPTGDMRPLFELIKEEIPVPAGDPNLPLQLQITTLDYDDYVGQIGIGRIV